MIVGLSDILVRRHIRLRIIRLYGLNYDDPQQTTDGCGSRVRDRDYRSVKLTQGVHPGTVVVYGAQAGDSFVPSVLNCRE